MNARTRFALSAVLTAAPLFLLAACHEGPNWLRLKHANGSIVQLSALSQEYTDPYGSSSLSRYGTCYLAPGDTLLVYVFQYCNFDRLLYRDGVSVPSLPLSAGQEGMMYLSYKLTTDGNY
ncbi:MAG TPA: hypothetical protein VHL57_11105, partial [Flavobacteriales bacterium]|nr:hypothetical protein [Flavobacteriales bacterium]